MIIELEQFYSLFWKSKVCRNVFLLHKELLLEKKSVLDEIPDYYLQRIVLSNASLFKDDITEHIIFRQDNNIKSLVKKISTSRDFYFNDRKIEEFYKKRFGQTIHIIETELENKNALYFIRKIWRGLQSEEKLLDFLKHYKVIPETIDSFNGLVEFYEKEVLSEIETFFKKQNMSHMLISIDDISDYYNSMLKTSLIYGHQQNMSVLIDEENFEDRLKLFDRLYEIKILEGGKFKSYFECVNCPPHTFQGNITCNISPKKIKIECPQCKQPTNYFVPYYIKDELFGHIIDKDGLLFFAVQYLLNDLSIKHTSNVNLENENEIDFVLKKGDTVASIVEIKMFRDDKSNEGLVKKIKDAFFKVKRTKKKLLDRNENYIQVPSYLITNIDDKDLVDEAKYELKSEMKEFNIKIFTPTKFHDFALDNL